MVINYYVLGVLAPPAITKGVSSMIRYITPEEKIKESISLQVNAKFRPKRINIPEGWVPKTAYDHHLVALVMHDVKEVRNE